MQKMLHLLLIFLMVFNGNVDENASAYLEGTSWRLVEIDKTDRLKPVNYRTYLSFESGKFTLNDGCNDVYGNVNITENRLEFRNFTAPNKVPCASSDKLSNAKQIINWLRNHAYYKIKGDYLIFYDANKDRLVFSRYQAESEESGWTKRTYKVSSKLATRGKSKMIELYDYVDKKNIYVKSIKGFTYEPGYEYEINMQISYINNQTSGKTNKSYELISINKKTRK